jgi:hypothetical protein
MRSITLILGLFILLGSVFGASAQGTPTPEVGGTGGAPFADPCHGSDVMIGFNITGGKAMNTFAAVCQAQDNGVLVGANYGLNTWGKLPGEQFPAEGDQRCPAGQAIYGMTIYVNKQNELDSLGATCVSLLPNGGPQSELLHLPSLGGVSVSNSAIGCGSGVAVGITGRSSDLMNSLGLECSQFPWHLAAAPPPTTQQFIIVKAPDDYYDQVGGTKEGTLFPSNTDVSVVMAVPNNPGWYEISWPEAPGGKDYYIFTGPGCDCLTIPQ